MAISQRAGHSLPMLIEAYIAALLVDEELVDQVWALWDVGLIDNELAAWAWCTIVASI